MTVNALDLFKGTQPATENARYEEEAAIAIGEKTPLDPRYVAEAEQAGKSTPTTYGVLPPAQNIPEGTAARRAAAAMAFDSALSRKQGDLPSVQPLFDVLKEEYRQNLPNPRLVQMEQSLNEQFRVAQTEGVVGQVGAGNMTPEQGAAALKMANDRGPFKLEELYAYFQTAPATPELDPNMTGPDMEHQRDASTAARYALMQQSAVMDVYKDLREQTAKDYPSLSDIDSTTGKVVKGQQNVIDWLIGYLPLLVEPFDAAQIAFDLEDSAMNGIWEGFKSMLAPGELRADIREAARKIDDPKEKAAYLKKVYDIIGDRAGVFGANDVIAKEWIESTLLGSETAKSNMDEVDRYAMNTLGLFVAGVGLKQAGKAGMFGLGSLKYTRAVKDVAAQVDAAIRSANPEQELAKLGLSQDQVLKGMATVKPAGDTAGINPNASPIVDVPTLRGMFSQEEILNLVERNLYPDMGEVPAKVATRFVSEYANISGGFLRQNLSTFRRVSFDTMEMNTVYGATDTLPFKRLGDAVDFATKLAGKDPEAKIFLQRYTLKPDGTVDKVVDVPFNPNAKRQKSVPGAAKDNIMVVAQQRVSRRPDDAVLFGTGAKPVMNTIPGPRGVSNRFLAPESRYTGEMVERAMQRLLFSERMASSISRMGSPLYTLPIASRNKVYSILMEGDYNGRQYGMKELVIDKGLTTREALGYMSYRNMSDTLWQVNNRRFRASLKQDDYKLVDIGSGQNYGSAKKGNEFLAAGDKGEVVDPLTKASVSKAKAREMVDAGTHEVLRVYEPHVLKNRTFNYVLVKKGTYNPRELPPSVLRYDSGYVPRLSSTPYSVVRIEKRAVDGVVGEQAELKHLAETALDMRKTADRLNAARTPKEIKNGVRYEAVDRTVQEAGKTRAFLDSDILERPQPYFTPRDPKSVLLEAGNRELLADPFEAMQRAIASSSRAVAWDDFMKMFNDSYFAHFVDIFGKNAPLNNLYKQYKKGLVSEERLYDAVAELKDGAFKANSAKIKRANEALDLRYYYQSLSGAMGAQEANAYRQFVLGTALRWNEAFDKLGLPAVGKKGAKGLQRLADTDITSVLRSIPFTFLIVGNPARQYNLQTMQFLFAQSSDPIASTRSIQGGLALRWESFQRAGAPGWKLTAEQATKIGKTMGISGPDYTALSKNFFDSGLIEGIDNANYWSAGIYNYSLGKTTGVLDTATQWSKNALLTAPHKALRDVGFKAGEVNNQMLTFVLAATRYGKEVGKTFSQFSPSDWNKVTGRSSRLTLSMNQAGQPLYQKGMLGVVTQFWAVQQKALFAMMPVWAGGSRAWTTAEKAKLAAMQFAYYGPYGLGIGTFARESIKSWSTSVGAENLTEEQTEWLTMALSYGLMETMYNWSLSAATGERVRIGGFAEGFAPAGGFPRLITDTAGLLLSGDVTVSDIGAFGSFLSKLNTTWKQAALISEMYEQQVIEGPEMFKRHTQNIMALYGGFDKATKAYYNLQIGKIASRNGPVLGESNFTEEFLRAFYGTTPKEEEEMNHLYDMMADADGREKIVSSVADSLIKELDRYMFRSGLSGTASQEEADTRVVVGAAQIRAAIDFLDPADAPYVIERIKSWMNDEREGVEPMIDRFIKQIDAKGAWSPNDATFNAIKGLEIFKERPDLEEGFRLFQERTQNDLQPYLDIQTEMFSPESVEEFKNRIKE
jgi:hypothetical protein